MFCKSRTATLAIWLNGWRSLGSSAVWKYQAVARLPSAGPSSSTGGAVTLIRYFMPSL